MKASSILLSLIGISVLLGFAAAASKSFTGATSYDWSDPTNWSPEGVPADGDDVEVLSRLSDVNLPSTPVSVHNVISYVAFIGQSGSSMSVTGDYSGTLTVKTATLTFESTATLNVGTYATLTDVTFINKANLNMSSLIIDVRGTSSFKNEGTLTMDDGRITSATVAAPLDNTGTLILGSSYFSKIALNNKVGGTLTVNGYAYFSDASEYGLSASLAGNVNIQNAAYLSFSAYVQNVTINAGTNFASTNSNGTLFLTGKCCYRSLESAYVSVDILGDFTFPGRLMLQYRDILIQNNAKLSIYRLVWGTGKFFPGGAKDIDVDYLDMIESENPGLDGPSPVLSSLDGYTLNVAKGGNWSTTAGRVGQTFKYLENGAKINIMSTAQVNVISTYDGAGMPMNSKNGAVGSINNYGRLTFYLGAYQTINVIFNNYGVVENVYDASVYRDAFYIEFGRGGESTGQWNFNALTTRRLDGCAVYFTGPWKFTTANPFNGGDRICFGGLSTLGDVFCSSPAATAFAESHKYFESNPTTFSSKVSMFMTGGSEAVMNGNIVFQNEVFFNQAHFKNGSVRVTSAGAAFGENRNDGCKGTVVSGTTFTLEGVFNTSYDSYGLKLIKGGKFVSSATSKIYATSIGDFVIDDATCTTTKCTYEFNGELILGKTYGGGNMYLRGHTLASLEVYDRVTKFPGWAPQGKYLFGADHKLTVYIGGDNTTDYWEGWDSYASYYSAQLDGTLEIILVNDFVPSDGMTYPIFNHVSDPELGTGLYGAFKNINVIGLPNGMTASIVDYERKIYGLSKSYETILMFCNGACPETKPRVMNKGTSPVVAAVWGLSGVVTDNPPANPPTNPVDSSASILSAGIVSVIAIVIGMAF